MEKVLRAQCVRIRFVLRAGVYCCQHSCKSFDTTNVCMLV